MKEVLVTNNYEVFKKLIGNRETSERRIEKIKKSILDVGYITSPILVNEKMEIIDGQGRFEALKQLQFPIEYIIQKGVGIRECIAMNVHQTNWSMRDYIKSYADKGVKSYVYIQDLLDKYTNYNINLSEIATATSNLYGFKSDVTKKGELIISEEQYTTAIKKLELVKDLAEKYKHLPRINLVVTALLHCMNIEELEFNKLKTKVIEILDFGKVPPIPTIDEAMQFMETIYNKNRHGKTLFIYTEYRKQVEERLAKAFRELNEKHRMQKYVVELDDLNEQE